MSLPAELATGQPPGTAPSLPCSRVPAQARAGTTEPTCHAVVLAVDGTGLAVRTSRAARRTGLHSSDGTPTGPVMMFIASLARKVRVTRPSHVVITWDGPDASSWRRELYPPYKGNRDDPGSSRRDVLAAMEFCGAAGMLQLEVPGFEADDLLAAVHRARDREMPGTALIVCSDDNDMLQLADECTAITGLTTDFITTADLVKARWGIVPGYLPYVRALAGDPSDNIPGLPGVGLRRAVRMFREAGMEWPLPEEALPGGPLRPGDGGGDRRELVLAWHQVMDLLNPPRRPEGDCGMDYFSLGQRARWSPEDASLIGGVLDKYELSGLSARYLKGRLW